MANMFWRKLTLMNIAFLLIIFKLFSIYIKYCEKVSPKYNSLFPREGPNGINFFDSIHCNLQNLFNTNEIFVQHIDNLRSKKFFRYAKVNLYEECIFAAQSQICDLNIGKCSLGNPLTWNKEEEFVDKLTLKESLISDNSSCSNRTRGEYIDLGQNRHSFTGYQGMNFWKAIYNQNCFTEKNPKICQQGLLFYKILSGWHSSVNIFLGTDFYDTKTHNYIVNHSLLIDRVTSHSDRLNNLFLLYSLTLKGFYKAEKAIGNYNYPKKENSQQNIQDILRELYTAKRDSNEFSKDCIQRELIDEESVEKFFIDNGEKIRYSLTSIDKIIDCISCENCRLFSKIDVSGINTLITILSNKNIIKIEEPPLCEKTNEDQVFITKDQFVSFINFLGNISKAIHLLLQIDQELRHAVESQKSIQFGALIFLACLALSGLILINKYFIKHRNYYSQSRLVNEMNVQGSVKQPEMKKTGNTNNNIQDTLNAASIEKNIIEELSNQTRNAEFVISKPR